MHVRLLSLALGALVSTGALSGVASAQQYVEVTGAFSVNDITPDGNIVVGSGSGGGFYWDWRNDPAPTYIGGNDASAVSDDGSVIVGCIPDPVLGSEVAARWTQATGWVSLGYLPNALSCPSRSNAYDVSHDGSLVVGLSWDGCNGRGFVWDDVNGMQELDVLINGRNRATTISGDGTSIGGFAQSATRSPVYWDPSDLTGFAVNPAFGGEVYGMTTDGSLSVGTIEGEAFLRTTAGGGLVSLDTLNPCWAGNATDITDDGATIIGYDNQLTAIEGWLWTAADGIVSLQDRMAALGLTIPSIRACQAISDNGSIIVGSAVPSGGGFSVGFIAQLTADGLWDDLGGGITGFNGVPQLTGSGPLVAGTTATLDLVNGPPSSLMLAWMSFAPSAIPYFGGTVFTLPFNTQILAGTSPAGTFSASTTWPVGVPSGTQLWFQFAMQDVSVVQGITISNGVRATTP